MTYETLNLFRCKVPQAIDLFSLENAGCNIIADGSVCQSGGKHQMADEIVISNVLCAHMLTPFKLFFSSYHDYSARAMEKQFEIQPLFHS